jgi:hypothetical protein
MPKHPQEPKKGKGLPEQELPAPNLVDTVAKNRPLGIREFDPEREAATLPRLGKRPGSR